MNNMTSNSDLWKKIDKTLMKQDAIGNSLTLKCEIHHDTLTQVQSEEDFYMVSEGGCSKICYSRLKCGHNCLSLCHPIDAEHKEYLCTADCERQVCINGHNCPDVCSKKCKRCKVLVRHLLPCGHSTMLQCHLDANKYDCEQKVPVVLELCGHKTEKQCHVNLNEVKCQTKCTDLLPCGHACTQLCHKDSDPDHVNFSCNEDSTRLNEDSVNENLSKKRCYEDCRLSTILVTEKRDECTHEELEECHVETDLNPRENMSTEDAQSLAEQLQPEAFHGASPVNASKSIIESANRSVPRF